MDVVWIMLGAALIVGGIAGSFLPVLPGPPLAFIGLWIQQLRSEVPFTSRFLWIWAAIVVGVTVMDYVIPVYSTKKWGGSKSGIWGCAIGLVIGLWFGPLGIIAGPFVGAYIGEMIAYKDSSQALKAATGSFIGFLVGTLLKLIVCVVIGWYWVISWV